MAKKCGYPECSTEISEWQDYCVEHYVKVSQEGLPEEQKQGETMEKKDEETMDFIVDEPPRQDSFKNIQQPEPTVQEVKDATTDKLPQLSQEQIKMIMQKEQMRLQHEAQQRAQKPKVETAPKPAPVPAKTTKPVSKPKTKIPTEARGDFPVPEKISEQQRLTIKMYALQSAVQMLSNMGYDNNFKSMIEDVRTLTSHFFRIVLERNEKV